MSHEAEIHGAQVLILRELLFQKEAGFAQLQKPTELTSDNFTFHIKRLVELGYVERVKTGLYKLSAKGKEYANKLDTERNTIERQPKVAVILAIEQDKDGETLYLFQQRLKHPYFGFWGFPTGKISWGETIIETAARELMEETGLRADLRHAGIYHEKVYKAETKEQLEDKIFHVVHCTNPKGKLQVAFEGGRNEWMTRDQAKSQDKIFDSFDIEIDIVQSDEHIVERDVFYTEDLF